MNLELIGCLKMSVMKYHSMLRNISQEHRPQRTIWPCRPWFGWAWSSSVQCDLAWSGPALRTQIYDLTYLGTTFQGKKLQFLPYVRSIGSWICLTHKTYTCHTVQNITDTHNIVLHHSQRYNLQKHSFVSYQGCVVHRWVFGVP
jgi:hypothetical protein